MLNGTLNDLPLNRFKNLKHSYRLPFLGTQLFHHKLSLKKHTQKHFKPEIVGSCFAGFVHIKNILLLVTCAVFVFAADMQIPKELNHQGRLGKKKKGVHRSAFSHVTLGKLDHHHSIITGESFPSKIFETTIIH